MNLAAKNCVPCEGGALPLDAEAVKRMLRELATPWQIIDGKKARREFVFKDFKEAVAFVNRVAETAEAEGHHPDIFIFYNRVVIELWTHAIGGLSENDFIVAAKVEILAASG